MSSVVSCVAVHFLVAERRIFLNPLDKGSASAEVLQSHFEAEELRARLEEAFRIGRTVREGDGCPMKKVLKVRSEKQVVRRTQTMTIFAMDDDTYECVRWVRAPRDFGFIPAEGPPLEASSLDHLVDVVIAHFEGFRE